MATAGDLQQIRVCQIPAFQQGVEKSPTAEAPPQEASCRQLLEKGDWMEEGQPRTRKQEAEAASTLDTHTIASDGRGLCGLEVFPLSRLPPESGTRHIFSPTIGGKNDGGGVHTYTETFSTMGGTTGRGPRARRAAVAQFVFLTHWKPHRAEKIHLASSSLVP